MTAVRSETFLDGRVTLHPGDCLSVLDALPPEMFDAAVTDPPYHLASIVKRFGKDGSAPARSNGKSGIYKRSSKGFMGQTWDGGDVAFQAETWAKVLRVLKPGAHLVAFAAPKNAHRITMAIELAGFEIRDVLMWLFGSGFPKSHNLPAACSVATRQEFDGWGTALKPAYEPIVLARKPLAEGSIAGQVFAAGTGALNIKASLIGNEVRDASFTSLAPCHGNALGAAGTQELRRGTQGAPKRYTGRWPANLVTDGSDEVAAGFPEVSISSAQKPGGMHRKASPVYGPFSGAAEAATQEARSAEGATGIESASALRFFYTAKADADDRLGSKHPTVKPVALMQWLVRMVTPPGGVILDAFAGAGTTGDAAFREGFSAHLIEREPDYQDDIRRRMALALAGPEERTRAGIAAQGRVTPPDDLPIFLAHQSQEARRGAAVTGTKEEGEAAE